MEELRVPSLVIVDNVTDLQEGRHVLLRLQGGPLPVRAKQRHDVGIRPLGFRRLPHTVLRQGGRVRDGAARERLVERVGEPMARLVHRLAQVGERGGRGVGRIGQGRGAGAGVAGVVSKADHPAGVPTADAAVWGWGRTVHEIWTASG